MLVSRKSVPGNWKSIMHFSFGFGSIKNVPFFCLSLMVEALEGMTALLISSTVQVKVSLWESKERCLQCDSVQGACSFSAKVGVCLYAHMYLAAAFCKYSSWLVSNFKHSQVLRREAP